ncbi:protein NLRC3-like [Acropora millepora]|uniref:protein NLRC3-like n=1 Tax=Acropora millepora TaxID=45264 RepID=UPI001CF482FD|nr:protein NLRC3-like [Acropora millepora]
MESLKDLLTPKTFNRISYVAVICWILYAVIVLGIFEDMENSDSFRCEAKLEKIDVVRGKCSDQYNNRYNKSGIPVYGLMIANFSFIGVVCVIYYQVVKSRVDEVEANRQRADAERPNNDGSRHKRRKLFVAYLCQLATRIVIGIVFIVLQNLVLYPDNFPSDYHCQIAAASHAVSASSTSNIQNSTMYECYNQQASKITSWMNAVIVGNIVLALIILIEIIYILALRVKKGKEFLEDSVFLEYLLNLPTREPQEPEHEQQQLIESRQIRQEGEPQERVSTQEQPQDPERQDAQEEDSEQVRLSPMGPQEQQVQQPSAVIAGFIESQRKSIRESTEKDRGLKPLFQEKPGQGKRIEAFKLDHIYTNLSLVKDIARYKITGNREEQLKVFPMPQEKFQQITREEIVDAKNKKILIVGRPGIGKTLFLTKWIRDWSSDKAFNGELHFKFAFFLKFREFNSEGKLSLRRLLSSSEYSETDLSDQVWNDICENPERVLIFFDGLDESLDRSSVAEASHCKNLEKQMPLSALFYNIVEGNLLRGASVLTTTRPSAVEEVTNLPFDKTIEILGFASEQVEEYVEKFVKVAAQDVVDAGKKIWEHIKTNMNIFSLCYIPVNCLIICSCLLQVLKFHGEKALTGVGLPTKLTEIYQICVKLFFLRHNEHRNKDLLQKDINSKHLPPEVEEKIRPLAKLAFDGLTHVQKRLIFREKEVPEDLADIALFHRLQDSKPNPFTSEAQYCFIHLTMQEFLAAKHITETMKGEELRTFVADHIENGEWQLVLQFVAGLLGEQSIDIFTDLLPKTTEKKDESVLMFDYSLTGRTVTCWPTKSEKDLALTLLKCIHETNVSGSVVQSKLEEIGFNAVDFSYCRLAPADCTAVVHFIKHIQQISLINLSFNNIGSLGCVEIVKLFDNTNCQLRGLNLRYNNMDDEGVEKLSNVLVNSQLSSLNLGENNITVEGVKQLSNVVVNSQLSSLSLGDNNIGDEGVKQLSNALVNNQLSSLNLWDNNITDKGVKQLSNVLVNSQLSSLVLGENCITDEGVKQLSNVLVNNNKLRRLNLCWNDEVTDEAKEQIRQANPNCEVSI